MAEAPARCRRGLPCPRPFAHLSESLFPLNMVPLQIGVRSRARLRPGVLHERGDLHDLDGGAHTIETSHALKQFISKERFGSVF